MTNMDGVGENLEAIYAQFERRAAPYRAAAVCRPGCALCCTRVGNVDATTMEALRIGQHLARLPRARRSALEKALSRNRRQKQRGGFVRCPFLQKNDTCMIYDLRPFSCRQLYSLAVCTEQGPTVHRQAVDLAKETVAALQRLDADGYSGHISYVLELLDDDAFRSFYLSGGFDPARVMAFARPRGLVINRLVAGGRPPADPAAAGG